MAGEIFANFLKSLDTPQPGVHMPVSLPRETPVGTGSDYSNIPAEPGSIVPTEQPPAYPKRIMRVVRVDLSVVNTKKEYDYVGTIIVINKIVDLSASGAPVVNGFLTMILDDNQNDPFTMEAGDAWSGYPFNKFFVSNVAQANLQAEIIVMSDTPDDSRLEVKP